MRSAYRLFVIFGCLALLVFTGVAFAKTNTKNVHPAKKAAPRAVHFGFSQKSTPVAGTTKLSSVVPHLSKPLRELAVSDAAKAPVGKRWERIEPQLPHFPFKAGTHLDAALQTHVG